MSKPYNLKPQFFIFSTFFLLVAGSFHLTLGQFGVVPVGAVSKPTNPSVNNKYLRSADAKKLSPTAKKQAAIEQAIKEGNEAREANNYEKAFASYRLVAEELNPKDARALYGLGNVYFDLACNDQAVQAYTDALRLDKDFHDALIVLGYIYVTKQRYDNAETQFRAVFRKAPQDAVAMIGLAHIAGKKRQYDEAIKQFHLIIDNRAVKNQERALAYLSLGNIYLEQKKWEDATKNLRKAIEINPSLSGAYLRLAQAELFPETSRFSLLAIQEITVADRERLVRAAKRAAEYIRTAINEHKYNHPYGYLLLAHALLNQFNYQEATANVEEYRRKVKELEDHASFLAAKCSLGFKELYASGHLYLAMIHNQQALLETDELKRNEFSVQVLEHAKKVIEIKAGSADGYALLGQTYFRMGNYSEAIRQFETEIINETNDETKNSTLNLIGFCHEQLGNDKEAVRAYNEALKLRANSPLSRLGLARINEKQGDFDSAIRLKKEALDLTQPPPASLFWQLGSTYFRRARQKDSEADYEEAIKLLRKALEMNPSFGPAYLTLGNAYKFYKNGALADEALANYQQAEKYAPKDAAIKFLIGALFYEVKKNYPAAINYLEDAIKLKPDYAAAHQVLGLVHRDKGAGAEAINHLRTALSLDDRNLQVYLALADIYEGRKDYDEAIKLWLKAADKLPLEYLPYKEVARLYSYQHKNQDAIRNYEEAISRIKTNEEWFRNVLRCRIVRLQGHFADSITCFQNIQLPSSGDPAQIPYEIGLTHVANNNKQAAFAQYEELKRRNSNLAENLLRAINEMK